MVLVVLVDLCLIQVSKIDKTLQASVTEDDLSRVTRLANEVIEAKLPVYCTSLSLDDALSIPGVVFLHDEACALSCLPCDVLHYSHLGHPVVP